MDSVYPEPMSLLRRRVVPKKRKGTSSRYRTQPVTFLEIQEVDEDNLEEAAAAVPTTSRSELSILNSKFDAFRRSRDLILNNLNNCDTNSDSEESTTQTLPMHNAANLQERSSSKTKPSRPSI